MKRVFAHIGFSFAITLIILNVFTIKAALAVLMIAGAAFAVTSAVKKTRRAVSFPLCAFSAFLACVLFISSYYGTFLPQKALDGKTAEGEFYIVDVDKSASGEYYYYTVKTLSIDSEGAPQNIKTKITSFNKIDADYYQVMKGTLRFRLSAENGFDSYGDFGDGIFLTSSLKSFEITDKKISSPYKYILYLRDHIKNLVKTQIGGDEGGFILAMLIGDKSGLSSEIKDNFRASGASHIMAVSGLHLAVLSGTVYWLLKKIRMPKVPRIILSFIAVFFYMALAGFSKSIVRAGIMMIILLAGRLFNEKSDSLNSLGFAVFIICLNPYAVTDAGASLTVTAVLGLLTVNPIISRGYKPKSKLIKYPYEILTASLSVFITTLPVLYFTFGYVSFIGVFLNIVMIPLAQFSLIISFVMVIFQWISPALFVTSFIAKNSASLILFITEKCALLPFAVRYIDTPEVGLAIAAVLFMFGVAFIFGIKKTLKTCAVISVALAIIILLVSMMVQY